jgi:hypothetical protein
MMKTKRRRKKRTGTSLVFLLAAFLPLAAAPKKKPLPENYAIISGSVFQDNGYALPGADVALAPESESGRGTDKAKPVQAVSDSRGEFVVRVPPDAMRYSITVHAKGYQSAQKSVTVTGEERVEVTFQLDRESK